MKLPQLLLAALAALTCAAAGAQWHWIDRHGRSVFSDRPPPPDIPEKNIRRQSGPRVSALDTVPAGEAASPAQVKASVPRPAGEDKALVEKRRLAADAEAAKRKTEEERLARLQAESCTRARQAKAGLDAGGRIARTNEKGEREFLDDAGRAAEAQRIAAIIAADCK